jgi:endonuclease/exonuclease/phosphatase family metal-dependent hydrolase
MTWGNRYVRIVTWAHFRDRPNARAFYVFNTHWDHESQPARERSARLILDRIYTRGSSDPVLLMGDFNAGEHNPAFRALLGDPRVRLLDTFRTLHPGAQLVGTYHAFKGDRSGDRIDAILVTPEWEVMEAAIVHFSEAGRFPSDHFPVTATLHLRQ